MGLLCSSTLKDLRATPAVSRDARNLTKLLFGVVVPHVAMQVDEIYPYSQWWQAALRPNMEARVGSKELRDFL